MRACRGDCTSDGRLKFAASNCSVWIATTVPVFSALKTSRRGCPILEVLAARYFDRGAPPGVLRSGAVPVAGRPPRPRYRSKCSTSFVKVYTA